MARDPLPTLQRVLIVGPGAVGGAIAVRTATAPGLHTCVAARGETAATIAASGLQVHAHDGKVHRAHPEVVLTDAAGTEGDPGSLASSIPHQDAVVLCVKSRDTARALDLVEQVSGPTTTVICLQNGVINDRAIIERMGSHRTVSGVVYVGAGRQARNVVVEKTPLRIEIGTPDGRELAPVVEQLVAAWRSHGVDVTIEEDVLRAKWQKFLFNAALNPLTALTDKRLGSILATKGGRSLFRSLVEEAVAVAHAEDAPLVNDPLGAVLEVAARMDISSSMAEDLVAGRPLEREAFGGFVLGLAEFHGVPTPVTRTIEQLLDVVDPGR